MLTIARYLARGFIHRLFEFLEHWYWGSFRVAGEKFIDLLKDWDKFFALRITIRHWLQPLYQDRTFIGYILGPIFRTGRIAVALIVYLVVIVIVAPIYAIWLLIPPYIIYKIITGIFNL
ncbi:MAG: hypothetical protein Q8P04_00500 [bacterium]|nr:hypothetical protein [bacterium]